MSENETKWTPGPWLLTDDCAAIMDSTGSTQYVALAISRDNNAERQANAHLIAAAPEMAEALAARRRDLDQFGHITKATAEKMDTALRLARGEREG